MPDAALPGWTFTIFTPPMPLGFQAGISSRVASGSPSTAMPW